MARGSISPDRAPRPAIGEAHIDHAGPKSEDARPRAVPDAVNPPLSQGVMAAGRLRDCLRLDGGWLAAATIALLLLTSAPYLVAALSGPSDLVRVGTFWFFRDFSQYLGAMHDGGASASWLLHNRFSAESHQPILMYIPYVTIGKLSALLGIEPMSLYYAAEVLARVALAFALYLFMTTFLATARLRLVAYLLATFSLGLAGWVIPLRLALDALELSDLSAALPPGVNVFLEMQSFGVFLSAPHLMLGLALTLIAPAVYLRAAQGSVRWVAALAVLALALGLIHPFNLPVVLSVLGIDALWRLRRGERAALLALVPAGLLAAPLVGYNALLFQIDPFWSGTYGIQNLMPSPSPLIAWVDFGIIMLAAPFGIWLSRPWKRPEQRLLVLWVALTLLWMYAPVVFQRRLGFGLQPGFAALAALALVAAQPRVRLGLLGARPFNYVMALLALSTTILVYVSLLMAAATNRPIPVYAWTVSEQSAAEWIAARGDPDEVVLASIESGNVLVGVIPGRVVVGHIVATLRAREKEELACRFFADATSPAERANLLAQSRATLVFAGPQERLLGQADLNALTQLEPLHQNGPVTVFRVRPSAEEPPIDPAAEPLASHSCTDAHLRKMGRPVLEAMAPNWSRSASG